MLYNGSFTHGLSGWRTGVLSHGADPGYPHVVVLPAAEPLRKCLRAHRGQRALQLNVPAGASGYVEQSIIVPVRPSRLTLRAWDQLAPVTVTVSVLSGPFVHRLLAFAPPPLLKGTSTCSGARPSIASASVGSFAGQAVGLRIRAESKSPTGAIAGIEDVTLEAR